MKIAKITYGALSIAAAIGLLSFTSSRSGSKATLASQAASSPPATVMESMPSPEQAFQVLYKTSTPSKSHLVDSTHHASIWFSQKFNDGVADFFTLFSQVKTLDEKGVPDSCHSCTVQIDAITYIHRNNGWTLESSQRNIAEIGTWGEAPATASTKILPLSSGNIAIAIPQSYSGQGTSYRGESLLNHTQSQWREVGYLELSGDNSGTNCHKRGEQPKQVEQDEGECHSFFSKYTLRKSNSVTYPDIVVKRTGFEFSEERGTVVPVKDEIYVYNGTKFESSRQKARAEAEASRNQVTATANNAPPFNQAVPEQAKQSASASETSKEATRKLSYCLLPAAQYGHYSSYDGGKSALKMLTDECQNEFIIWSENCEAQGTPSKDCNMQAAILAQFAIKSFQK